MYRMYVRANYVRTSIRRLFIIFQKVVVVYSTFEDVRAYLRTFRNVNFLLDTI